MLIIVIGDEELVFVWTILIDEPIVSNVESILRLMGGTRGFMCIIIEP